MREAVKVIEEKFDEIVTARIQQTERLLERINYILVAVVIGSTMFPLLFSLFGVLSQIGRRVQPGQSFLAPQLIIVSLAEILMGLTFFFIASAMSPKIPAFYRSPKKVFFMTAPFGIILALLPIKLYGGKMVAGTMTVSDMLVTLGLPVLGFAIIGIPTYLALLREGGAKRGLLRNLSDFFLDLAEQMRLGSGLNTAILYLAGRKTYGQFNEALRRMANLLAMGATIEAMAASVAALGKEWTMRAVGYVSSQILRYSNLNPDILILFSNFLAKLDTYEKTVVARSRFYRGLTVFAIALLAGALALFSTFFAILQMGPGADVTAETMWRSVNAAISASAYASMFVAFLAGLAVGRVTARNVWEALWFALLCAAVFMFAFMMALGESKVFGAS